jgi:putative DNA methylase
VAYGDAVAMYLACALSRLTDYSCSMATWNPTNENVRNLFQRQAIPMTWDFAEANVIDGKLTFENAAEWVAGALDAVPKHSSPGRVIQLDARQVAPGFEDRPVVSTDPPYYDNIGYADLSDFFYVWLRHVLRRIDPQLFATLLTPKDAELIASRYRHGGSEEKAETHFRDGFAMFYERVKATARTDVPITIYYAFKQSEEDEDIEEGRSVVSTGWESMLEGLVTAGFQVTGTLPVRTTKKARSVARGTNALASAIVIVCRPKPETARLTIRREFVKELKTELPAAMRDLQQCSIAPVDLAQAAIGPGMAVFTRYAKVMETDGNPMTVRTALGLINQALDEVLAEQEGEFDGDTRFALTWFEQHGMQEGPFGEADVLARAKDTAVNGLRDAGVVHARGGKVRLVRRDELDDGWDPVNDRRLTVWEATQHLIRRLETGGELAAATLLYNLGGYAETARDLAYRLYSICDHKKWAEEALAYNALVIAWPELTKLAHAERTRSTGSRQKMFEEE